MPIQFHRVIPWCRSFNEYVRMFSLTPGDLDRWVLDCGGGPASFNAVMAARGKRADLVDSIYGLTVADIRRSIEETFDDVLGQTAANADKFIWKDIASVEELGRLRMAAMEEFLLDYEQGTREGRYVCAELPSLPFASGLFDIALCSHFLFLYSANLSLDFHRRAIEEMLRVATEVRVFPLVDLDSVQSPHVGPVIAEFTGKGCTVAIEKVDYEFQKGGDRVLRIVG